MSHSKAAFLLAAVLVASGIATGASAQTTGGVFGPVVREGHRSIEYRSAFDPDADAFAQRLHYQESIDSTFMWRIVAQTRKTADADVDFDFVQGELFWDLTEDDRRWQTGVRFDARIRDRGRPATIGVNWMNQYAFPSEWHGRFLVLTAFDIGEGARDGAALQTRANLYRALSGRYHAGLELFSSYGTTAEFADLDEQRHGLGPFVSFPVSNGWSIFAGALFGLTDSTPDTDLRFWVTRSF